MASVAPNTSLRSMAQAQLAYCFDRGDGFCFYNVLTADVRIASICPPQPGQPPGETPGV